VDDAALGAAEDAAEFSVGAVVDDVVAAVAIEDVELAVGQVERPRRAILVFLLVFAGGRGPVPLVEERAVEGGLGDAVGGEVGDEENFAVALGDERRAVGAGEGGAPLVDEATGAVVDDDVVRRVVGEENDVAGAIAGEAVAVVDGSGGRIEDAPAGDDAVAEVALAEEGSGGLGAGGDEGAGGRAAGGFEEVAAGEHGRGGADGRRQATPRHGKLGEDVADDLAVDVGEAELATLELVGELFVVHAELVEDGGLKIVDVDFVFGRR